MAQDDFSPTMRKDACAEEKVLVRVQLVGEYVVGGGNLAGEWLLDPEDPDLGVLAGMITTKTAPSGL